MPPWPSSSPGWLFELSINILFYGAIYYISAYHGWLVVSFSVLYCFVLLLCFTLTHNIRGSTEREWTILSVMLVI